MNTVSFWTLPTGSLFLAPWEKERARPYEKVGECQFARPGGKRRWTMFRPCPPVQPEQFVIALGGWTRLPKNFIMVNMPASEQKEMRVLARQLGHELRNVIRIAVVGAKHELEQKVKLAHQLGLRPIALQKIIRGNVSN